MIRGLQDHSSHYYDGSASTKPWWFLIGRGGSSNAWFGCAPRFLPEDFELASRFGHGVDWPIRYGDLEAYYGEAERILGVSGQRADHLIPRSTDFPLTPHRLSSADRMLQKKYPDSLVPLPSARPTKRYRGRSACCGATVCNHCPVDAKFRIESHLPLWDRPGVHLRTGCSVEQLVTSNNVVQSVLYRNQGRYYKVQADLVFLGANGLFNPWILQKSSIKEGNPGTGINEQAAIYVDLKLKGVKNFDGGTGTTAHLYHLARGNIRKQRAACLIETSNTPFLRPDYGRWTERLVIKMIYEDLRQSRNRVLSSKSSPGQPAVRFRGHSEYTRRSMDRIREDIEELIKGLPVESYRIGPASPAEAHIQGSTAMGHSPEDSVVDHSLKHHRYRNLIVGGSGVFPTSPASNPTLTICALSLRAAKHL